MADTASQVDKILPLTPAVFHILLALTDKERHGYGIMLEVEAMTKGRVEMGPGTLYGTIKRMLKAGLIEESDERPDPELDDERRRYYRLTGFGRRVLAAEAERLSALVDVAQSKRVFGGVEAT
ncbi:MAG: PadR family transcriptional regulator [Anaerolineae bacterium]|jgi:DNA-binding PadR family transcriptional regulator